ncbi:MAG: ABC transporter ATP-binding protein/permease [Kiritimatiellaeota bacterium]|nr:ABC transporter ATP-binding protein/permease [Kiritimatiellota bacterium]
MGKTQNIRKDDLRVFIRLIKYAKPYWARLLIGAVCSVMGGGSIIAMFMAGQQLLGFVMDSRKEALVDKVEEVEIVENVEVVEKPALPAVSRFVPRQAIAHLNTFGGGMLFAMCGALLLMILVNSLAYFASMYLLQWVGQRVVMDLRVRLFAHLQKLPISFHTNSSSGDMISRTVADTQLLQHTVTSVITDTIRQPFTFLMVLSYILFFEWKLAVFSIVLLPTVVLPIILIGRRLRRISREGQKRLAELTSVMKEALDGVAVVKAFGQEAREETRFAASCRGFFRRMIDATKAKALSDPITHTIGGVGGIAVLLYALTVAKPLEECVIFACAIWALYEPVKKLGRISMEIQQSSAAADRVFEILDTPVSITDTPGAVAVSGPLHELEFKDVAFNYGEKSVFDALNLRVAAGESLALVGPSGGGKTTLVGLLLRFFDPQSGAVLRNGHDLREFTLASLRANIGLVMQDTFLFNATIAENIAYGKPEATPDEIIAAAKLAHAHEFITAKEHGYDTIVGERGAALSGGQKQRVAIARALLRDPSVLILDEATSALDTESERVVQQAIDDLMGRMTIIVIAHRLSTISKCDKIAVITDGGVAEYGTQTELLAKNGMYARLHGMQYSK